MQMVQQLILLGVPTQRKDLFPSDSMMWFSGNGDELLNDGPKTVTQFHDDLWEWMYNVIEQSHVYTGSGQWWIPC